MEYKVIKTGNWGLAERALNFLSNTRVVSNILEGVVHDGALFIRAKLKKAVETGRPEWPPLSKMTMKMKGSSKALQDKGDLTNAVTLWREGINFNVGIRSGEKGSQGQDLETVARIHEFGAVIKVTDQMRRWFRAQAAEGKGVSPLRDDTQVIVIPRRALFAPVLMENVNKLKRLGLRSALGRTVKLIGF